jgi:uncharacterized protein YndB with AHSA1/START domain
MNTQTTMPPVRKTVTVKQPLERAFVLFTGRIADWWPGADITGDAGDRSGTVVLEPRPQGKVYRRYEDGAIEYWGEVQVWEPPHRLVLVWQPAGGMSAPTEVEITFTAADDGTRVELEHRGWDRLGDQAVAARNDYDTRWDDVLRQYAAAGRDNGSAIASLILGITSMVVPILGILAAPFAIVFGITGRRRAREGASQGGLATAGLTLGAIGFVLWGVLIAGGAIAIRGWSDGEEEGVPVPHEPVPTGQVEN